MQVSSFDQASRISLADSISSRLDSIDEGGSGNRICNLHRFSVSDSCQINAAEGNRRRGQPMSGPGVDGYIGTKWALISEDVRHTND